MKGAREVRRQTGLWSLRPGQIFPLLPASVYPSCKMGLRLPPLGRFSEPGWLKSGWKGSGGLSPPPKPRKENGWFSEGASHVFFAEVSPSVLLGDQRSLIHVKHLEQRVGHNNIQ